MFTIRPYSLNNSVTWVQFKIFWWLELDWVLYGNDSNHQLKLKSTPAAMAEFFEIWLDSSPLQKTTPLNWLPQITWLVLNSVNHCHKWLNVILTWLHHWVISEYGNEVSVVCTQFLWFYSVKCRQFYWGCQGNFTHTLLTTYILL